MSVLTVYSLDVSHIESSSTLIPADIVIFAKNKLDIELHSSYENKKKTRKVGIFDVSIKGQDGIYRQFAYQTCCLLFLGKDF